MKNYLGLLFVVIFGTISCTDNNLKVDLQINSDAIPVQLAVEKFNESAFSGSFEISDVNPDLIIKGTINPSLTSEEAYSIRQDGKHVAITGGGATGLVYGLYDVKKQLSEGKTEITNADESPHYSFRALKFNLPWSSYRRSEALQQHYETCRDTAFWESFLDMMVENRFNKLTLWNLHPFNYMVRLEKYPEANSMSDEELAEWRQFWTTLFSMAKDRGVETYLVNWNIFVSPEFAEAHNVANYSITGEYFVEGDTASIIKDYTRESVRAVIDEYPDLTGLGITLGEAMFGMGAEQREEWLLDGFIQGMRDASRKIKFIHRVPLTKGDNDNSTTKSVEQITRNTLDTLTCLESPIIIELKYNWSHGHSSPHLFKVHGGKLADTYWNPPPTNYKLSWMVRNEDFFILRWGQPEFIREHIALNSQDHITGYFVGSETYIPAVDYFTGKEKGNWKYAFERQWMFYKQWGHLLYNPETPDEFFVNSFESRFPGNGKTLFEAQSLAGRVPLILGSYWDATWDYSLYSEGMLSILGNDNKTKLISLKQLAEKTPMDTLLMSVYGYVDNIKISSSSSEKITPYEMADSIESFCNRAIDLVKDIHVDNDVNLMYEKTDILTWANLGLYLGHKLLAAVSYQQFVTSSNTEYHEQAVAHLEKATKNWEEVVVLTSDVYKETPLQHYNRNEDKYFHWSKVYAEVKDELDWLKNEVPTTQN
ncbi:MAG: hypothetical protein WD577_11380 [Bacteroidales bacterium]